MGEAGSARAPLQQRRLANRTGKRCFAFCRLVVLWCRLPRARSFVPPRPESSRAAPRPRLRTANHTLRARSISKLTMVHRAALHAQHTPARSRSTMALFFQSRHFRGIARRGTSETTTDSLRQCARAFFQSAPKTPRFGWLRAPRAVSWAHPMPHLHRTGLTPCQICTGTGLAAATSGPGTGLAHENGAL
jgi:hypothetical protein